MDTFQLTIVTTAVIDTRWGAHDADDRRRQLTAEELDARADRVWPWASFNGVVAAWANAVRVRWRPRAGNRIVQAPVPAAEAASVV